ncbi:nucleolar protein 12 [Episyrphus balteatus]|uniref:nucleolar protein 12 n=1 Tax=Episyrphus balteatus TaxID=286459 RepID=UPI002486AB48|nr:nucleolar protein 12 [Episyrphus balteatus]
MGKTRPPKKKKLEIVFNPEKRKDFLTGFRKRKNERRKKAKEQLENTLKEERKRIRKEIKDGLSHLKKTFEPLKELTEQDKVEEEYEDDDVKVKIVELSTSDLAAQNNLIGENRGAVSESEEEEPESDEEDQGDALATIPGMDLVEKKTKAKSPKEKSSENKNKLTNKELKSKKDVDRLKKTKTFNKLKKSKAFKMKERLDKKVNQKKLRRDRNNTLKSLPKSGIRKLKKSHPTKFNKGRMMSRKQRREKKN